MDGFGFQLTPDLVLSGALLTLVTVALRAITTRKWVPGVFYEDLARDRDAAIAAAKLSADDSRRHLEMYEELSKSYAELSSSYQKLSSCRYMEMKQ